MLYHSTTTADLILSHYRHIKNLFQIFIASNVFDHTTQLINRLSVPFDNILFVKLTTIITSKVWNISERCSVQVEEPVILWRTVG